MGLVESIEKTHFIGSHRGQALDVTVDIFESPSRVWLTINGVRRERQDVPARFELGDGAHLRVDGKGMAVSECAIIEGDTRTGLELAPDSGIRRYVGWADVAPVAGAIRNGVFFVVIPVSALLGLAAFLNAGFLAGPLDAIGVSQPVDLPFPSSGWYIALAVGLLVGLGFEEDTRKAWRRHLAPSRQRVSPAVDATVPATGTVASGEKPAWGARLDHLGRKLDEGWSATTTSRFTGRHAGRRVEVVFDYFDEPTHARLLVDGEDRGNKGVPARFDLGDGATLEAEATQWAVTECAIVTGDQRQRLQPVNAQVERWHDRYFTRHPRVETVVSTIGSVVIAVAGVLGLIDLYNTIMEVGGRILGTLLDRTPLPDPIPVISTIVDWIPDRIDLPIGLTWWQAILIAAIPALFAFDRDVRRSNRRFGTGNPGTRGAAHDTLATDDSASGRPRRTT